MIERFGQGPLDSRGLPKISFLTGTESASGGPSVNVYRGVKPGEGGYDHAFSRGFTAFDVHMGELFPTLLPLDRFLDRRIDQAKQSNRDVILVDLGAGDGNLTRQALKEPEVMPFARRKLGRKGVTATTLRFYSVTDATKPDEHLRRTPFTEADARGNERFGATEVKYSITSSQKIKKLMEELDVNSVDVVTASNFMSYLPLQVFEGVTEDVINLLPSGGEFRVFGYATFAGSRLVSMMVMQKKIILLLFAILITMVYPILREMI
jgi:phospholipid N-methyltransferase